MCEDNQTELEKVIELDALDIFASLARLNASDFSEFVLNTKYEKIQRLLYPKPSYNVFNIKKRSGGLRTIKDPNVKLKRLQQKLLSHLSTEVSGYKPCAHAFIKQRSIVTNARVHLDRLPTFVLNLDLKDFFTSITFFRVRGLFRNPPFNFSHAVATVVAQICTVDNELPQGAPTSPFISNLICRRLDRELMHLAKQHHATYTRYADDITFSFTRRNVAALPSNICTYDSGKLILGNELIDIIKNNSFVINPNKTRISSKRSRMEITGIVINEFTNVKRDFIDRIRGALHAWDKYGYEAADQKWRASVEESVLLPDKAQPWKRQTRTKKCPQLKNLLWGKLLYLRMVRGSEDALYTRLAEKFNALLEEVPESSEASIAGSLPIVKIVRNTNDVGQATFVVEWTAEIQKEDGTKEFIGGQGTAFAYRQHNRLMTCDHVFRNDICNIGNVHAFDNNVINLEILANNPATGFNGKIKLMEWDFQRDLALLEFENSDHSNRYFSSRGSAMLKKQEGYLIGFPNWSPGRPVNIDYVNSSVHFTKSLLKRLDISHINIRKGYSGGPYVDDLFRLAGIAQQGALQESGNNECLCVTEIDSWLDSLKLVWERH